jgi:DNA repair exonuclease SbcCD ATPase subunit
MRKRQSMHILDLEAKLDQLASENRYLHDAIDQTTPSHPSTDDNVGLQDMLRTRDSQLQEKDAEIQQIRSLLEPLQREITKLTDVNNNLSEVNRSFTANNNVPYATVTANEPGARRSQETTP